MQRIEGMYVDPNANGTGVPGFREREPGIHAATPVSAGWLNGVQEEIAGAVEGRGIALDPSNKRQLLDAILNKRTITTPIIAGNITDNPGWPGFEKAQSVLLRSTLVTRHILGLPPASGTKTLINRGAGTIGLHQADLATLGQGVAPIMTPDGASLDIDRGEAIDIEWMPEHDAWRVVEREHYHDVPFSDFFELQKYAPGAHSQWAFQTHNPDNANVVTPEIASFVTGVAGGFLGADLTPTLPHRCRLRAVYVTARNGAEVVAAANRLNFSLYSKPFSPAQLSADTSIAGPVPFPASAIGIQAFYVYNNPVGRFIATEPASADATTEKIYLGVRASQQTTPLNRDHVYNVRVVYATTVRKSGSPW